MRYLLTILFLMPLVCGAQLVSFFVRGDTLFSYDPGNATERQLTRFIPPLQSGSYLCNNGTTFNWVDVNALLNLKSNISSPSFTGNVTTTGTMGYTTGAGGTVTQVTSKTTAVTLNKISGRITMNGAALAAGAEVAFTLTNSTIAAADVVIVNVQSVGTAGAYLVGIGAVSAGSCSITVSNASAGSLSQAIVLNFAVIKSAIN